MSRGVIVRLLLVIGLLAGCVALALNIKPTLGLDLKGGSQITLQTYDVPGAKANAANTDKVVQVLKGRIDALGVAEPNVFRSGENRVIAELPGVQNADQAREVLGKTAQLTVNPVLAVATEGQELTEADKKAGNAIYPDPDTGELLLVGPAVIKGDEIKKATAQRPDQQVEYVVSIDFKGKAGDAWATATSDAACARDQGDDAKSRTAIVLDNKILTAPVPNTEVACGTGIQGGSTQITGNFTLESAKELATLIEGGALPLKIKEIQVREIGPTLGKDAIKASWQAGLIGLILTGLFITGVYRLVGLTATIALSSYALLSYAMLVTLGSTLTLPGLAGFVLAIGLAIDANVLVFERAREEYLAHPAAGLRRALMVGFNKAWSAIMDSNVTTMLAAVLLFFLGSGPIKGFGVTLIIGTIASMISALVIARVLTEVVLSLRAVQKRPKITGIGHQSKVRAYLDSSNINIMKSRGKWLGVSVAALALAGLGIAVNGLNFGVEFTGGRQLEYTTTQPISVEKARVAVTDAGFPEATVQRASNDKISVRTGKISDQEAASIEAAIGDVAGGAKQESSDTISGSLGKELRTNAIIAFGLAFLAQLVYLAFRFKWTFGLAAVLAMAHDVFLVVGLFAWLGKPIDGIFLAAAMTIIGLSVNDTVVVFDRIRERWQSSPVGASFSAMANRACLETVPRTINTGLGAMFILAALAVLGGDSLQDFAIALLVGLIVGTYSSTFTATPLVTYLQEKWPMSQTKRVRVERDASDVGAVV